MKNEEFYLKAKEEGKVLTGVVKMVQLDKESGEDILVVDLEHTRGVITRDEIDSDLTWRSLIGFIGREIHFTVKEVDAEKNTVYGSRKEAQEQLKEGVVKYLSEGVEVNAEIVNTTRFGAYVETEGVTGLLKNVDFASDYTAIRDMKRPGDMIKVRLRKETESGRLLFEAVEKFKHPTIMEFDVFEPDQIVFGVVRNVKPFGAFVSIAPNIDALCSLPGTGEVEEGMKVSFRITQVRPEEKRVRGKILRILPN